MINKSDTEILLQLIEASNDAANKLEEAQEKGNLEEIEKLKKTILDFQKRVDEILK